jgi:ribonucleotide reductase beta subunit family protein with ferritin-like domain
MLVQSEANGITVLNTEIFDVKKSNMFFGPPLGLQRYDEFRYPVFDKLTDQQLGFFWRPQEVSLQKDRNDYLELTEHQRHIYTSNLKYQIMLDSVQGRAPGLAFIPYCSLPELESCMTVWMNMEMIHSRSYTYIIKNVYSNPEDIFDNILNSNDILTRARSITSAYDDFINSAHHYDSSNDWKYRLEGVESSIITLYELKRKLFKAMVIVNILEGIRFYVSFACSFAFGELKLMEGSAKILSLIARDENVHLNLTQNIINKWRTNDDPDMKKIFNEEIDWIYRAFSDAVDEEKRWADYLFKDGSLIGLNDKLLHNYIEWIANRRIKSIGLKPIYDIPVRNNPLPWTEHWLSSKGLQVAPQETEVESYIVGGLLQDITENSFSDFKL